MEISGGHRLFGRFGKRIVPLRPRPRQQCHEVPAETTPEQGFIDDRARGDLTGAKRTLESFPRTTEVNCLQAALRHHFKLTRKMVVMRTDLQRLRAGRPLPRPLRGGFGGLLTKYP